MHLPADPFTNDPQIRLLCDILDPDDHPCSCLHGIDQHADWTVYTDQGEPMTSREDDEVGHCLVSDCPCVRYVSR